MFEIDEAEDLDEDSIKKNKKENEEKMRNQEPQFVNFGDFLKDIIKEETTRDIPTL